jgi:hypothetical protein
MDGFDIYQVRRQGEHTPTDPNLTYRVGGQEDVQITVNPVDMGLDVEGPLTIAVDDIRQVPQELGVAFVEMNADEDGDGDEN